MNILHTATYLMITFKQIETWREREREREREKERKRERDLTPIFADISFIIVRFLEQQ